MTQENFVKGVNLGNGWMALLIGTETDECLTLVDAAGKITALSQTETRRLREMFANGEADKIRENIDTSDIPEAGEEFFQNARLVMPGESDANES